MEDSATATPLDYLRITAFLMLMAGAACIGAGVHRVGLGVVAVGVCLFVAAVMLSAERPLAARLAISAVIVIGAPILALVVVNQ